MGFEYRLSFACPSRKVAELGLSRLEGVKYIAAPKSRFEFRSEGLSTEYPDATASIEEYGLYFCVHGHNGQGFLGQVIAHLVGNYGAVRVAELE